MTARITYYPERVWPELGFKAQAVSGADRPYCALTAALACWQEDGRGLPRKGSLRGQALADIEDPIDVGRVLAFELREQGVEWVRANNWARALRRERTIRSDGIVASITRNDGERFTLDRYQIAAVEHMTPAGGVMDLDTGLGKTASAVCWALTVAELEHAGTARCWVFCPLNAVPAWEEWTEELGSMFADVRIVSIDSAHRLIGAGEDGGVVIWDEAQLLGGGQSRRTKAAVELRKSFDAGCGLTGTFLHGGVERTLSVLDLAIPGAAIFATRWKCGDRFDCVARKQIGPRTVSTLEKPRRSLRDDFFRFLSLFAISQDKGNDQIREQIGLGDVDQELVVQKVGDRFGTQAGIDLWARCALELARGDPDKGPLDEVNAGVEWPHAAAVMHAMARYGLQEKLDWLAENLEDTDLPLVLFANYRDSLEAIQEALEGAELSFVRVDGDVVGKDRSQCLRAFTSGEVDIFLGQMTAASVSMNLQRASISIAFDYGMRATDYYQCLGRTYRRGQTRDCLHIDLVANDLQAAIVSRLREAMDFDASCSEWQSMKALNDDLKGGH